MMYKKNKGITLIELLITLGFMSVILITSFSVLKFTTFAFEIGKDEYDLQSSVRIANEKINSLTRYSTAVFTIPESSFKKDNLTNGWSYFGVVNNGKPGSYIVNYVYNESTKDHDEIIIMAAKTDLVYKVVFDKKNPHDIDNLIEYTIDAYSSKKLDSYGNPINKISITSEVEGLNSLQLIDNGTVLDKAIAIAYIAEERTTTVAPYIGHVAMVLDVSGSMKGSKLEELKNEGIKLINIFSAKDNVKISLVPFATKAYYNMPEIRTMSATDDAVELKSYFENKYKYVGKHNGYYYKDKNGIFQKMNRKKGSYELISSNGLTALGGTNTGDGIRRAYYKLKKYEDNNTDKKISNYLIILVDGETTYGSKKNFNYFLDEGDIDDNSGYICGTGSHKTVEVTDYVKKIGNLITNDKNAKGNQSTKVYVISFGAGIEAVENIKNSCGSDNVYVTGEDTGLEDAFAEIQDDIITNISILNGPSLKN